MYPKKLPPLNRGRASKHIPSDEVVVGVWYSCTSRGSCKGLLTEPYWVSPIDIAHRGGPSVHLLEGIKGGRIRHYQTTMNLQNYYLTPVGHEQAESLNATLQRRIKERETYE